MRSSLLTLFIIALTFVACSHKNTEPVLEGEGLIVFKGARLIDGMGGPVRDKVNVILREDRIVAIQNEKEKLPPKAQVIDLKGKTIMPTLMSSHVHLGLTNGTKWGIKQITPENDQRQLRKFLQYGVGGVLSLGLDYDFIYQMRADSEKPDATTPLVLTAGRGMGVPEVAPPKVLGFTQVYRPRNIAETKKNMTELLSKKPNVVKIWVDDFGHSVNKKMDPEIYRVVIDMAHEANVPVAAHVYYLEDAKKLAQAGVDIFAHSIRDQPVDMELMSLMKMHSIAYIPTLSMDEAEFVYAEKPEWMKSAFFRNALDEGMENWLKTTYKPNAASRQDLKMALANVLMLYKSGIVVGLGTDSGVIFPRIQGWAEHRELQLLVQAGFTPLEAIRAATVNNANIMGITKDYAGLAPGMKANILVLDADPSQDIANTEKINSVWINGRQVVPAKK